MNGQSIVVLVCLNLLTSSGLSAQSSITENQTKEKEAMDSTFSSSELVCLLSGPELTKRLKSLQTKIFKRAVAIGETDKGYRLSFEDDHTFLLELMDYILAEKKCCPFLSYQLTIQENQGGVDLLISGPEGVKEFMRGMFESHH